MITLAPLDLQVVGNARLHAAARAAELGTRRDRAADVVTITSELAANAVRATRACRRLAPVWVRVSALGNYVLVEVGDSAPGSPVLCPCEEPLAESGRGLVLVAALAAEWGWQRQGQDKVVWALVAR